MRIRCINRPFQDLDANEWREVGDEWEATPERLADINRAGYGAMAEAVPEPVRETPAEPSQTASSARKASAPKKGTGTRQRARKSAQEG